MESVSNMQAEKISILFSRPGKNAGSDDRDTLEQVESVWEALETLGYRPRELQADENLPGFKNSLEKHRGNLIFNLCDPPAGEGRFISLFPLILEQTGFPYTGCRADALYLTSHKIISKKMMRRQGIPTAEWYEAGGKPAGSILPGRIIIKSVWEHGSAGLTPDSVVNVSRQAELDELLAASGPWIFAERFLPGREINISLLSDGKGGWEVLPPSEIIYSSRDDPAPFLDYKAKWETAAESYRNSSASLQFAPGDAQLLRNLSIIALECAELFSLNGYARVDFRLDETGSPQVLEVNANPCISPGAGFAAATAKAGLSYKQMIDRIVAAPIGVDYELLPGDTKCIYEKV